MSFLDTNAEAVGEASVRLGNELEISLDYDFDRQLGHNIVSVSDDNKIVILTAMR